MIPRPDDEEKARLPNKKQDETHTKELEYVKCSSDSSGSYASASSGSVHIASTANSAGDEYSDVMHVVPRG